MYKYGARAHIQELLTKGRLRIGTLHDFRRSEHKAGIADPREGQKSVFHVMNRPVKVDDGSLDDLAMKHYRFINAPSGATVEFSNVAFTRNVESPDCYVYCASSALSRETMSEFEGADACYQIVDPVGFCSVVHEELNRITPIADFAIAEVEYLSREEAWTPTSSGRHPAFIKEPHFSRQAEIRCIWRPADRRPISPTFVSDPRLRDYCVVVDV